MVYQFRFLVIFVSFIFFFSCYIDPIFLYFFPFPHSSSTEQDEVLKNCSIQVSLVQDRKAGRIPYAIQEYIYGIEMRNSSFKNDVLMETFLIGKVNVCTEMVKITIGNFLLITTHQAQLLTSFERLSSTYPLKFDQCFRPDLTTDLCSIKPNAFISLTSFGQHVFICHKYPIYRKNALRFDQSCNSSKNLCGRTNSTDIHLQNLGSCWSPCRVQTQFSLVDLQVIKIQK